MALVAEHSRDSVPGTNHGFRSIKLACKSERIPVDWDGSYADLARLFTEEFTQNEEPEGIKLLDRDVGGCLVEARRAFRLWDPGARVAYENFDLDDVREGDTIQVNLELYDWMLVALDARCMERRQQARLRKLAFTRRGSRNPDSSSMKSESSTAITERAVKKSSSIGSSVGSASGLKAMRSALGSKLLNTIKSLQRQRALRARAYAEKMEGRGLDPSQWVFLTFREKLWVTLEYPSSGPVAFALSAAILLLIAFSTVTYCAQTLHGVYRHDLSRNSFWFASEAFCASCFTAEFAARLYASPDRRVFAKDSMNIIDIVAIVPFYVDLIADAASGGSSEAIPGLAVIRVFRMARVFRLLRMSRSSADLFAETAANSVRALTMLLLVIGIGLVVFSSLMYFIERGRWDERLRVWERPRGYACEVTVTSSSFAHPNSFDQVSKPNLGKNQSVGTVAAVSFSAGAHHPCAFVSMRDDALAATFLCEYAFEKNRECATLYEQSPFDSVLRSMWWTWVTATTVGYGDVNPRSILGKTMGGVVMSFGVLVLALPVTVVGSNFSAAFHRDAAKRKARAKKERLRERKRLASHMNSAASSPSFSRLTSLNEI